MKVLKPIKLIVEGEEFHGHQDHPVEPTGDESNLEKTLDECAESGQTLVVELPDQRLLAIHSLDPNEDDSLMDELLASNPRFQELVAKSKASPRKPFPSRRRDLNDGGILNSNRAGRALPGHLVFISYSHDSDEHREKVAFRVTVFVVPGPASHGFDSSSRARSTTSSRPSAMP